jgi:hypothetical protein
MTYVDSPELFDAVEADDFLEELVPILLAVWWLGEPQGPNMLQLMLHVEVGWIIEDRDDLVAIGGAVGGIGHWAVGRDWNGVKRYRLRRLCIRHRDIFLSGVGLSEMFEVGQPRV